MPLMLPADAASIAAAAGALAAHQPVAMPTETVYGLAAGTLDEQGIERIYALKGRPANNPLIAHVDGQKMAQSLVYQWDTRAQTLADAFWPGPLTLVLPRHERVPAAAAGGLDTLAVRSPAHPVARALLATCGMPLSAPSANRSGGVSPTCASHVVADYADVPEAHDLIVLDGGRAQVGLESTVLDLTNPTPKVLRPGTVGLEALEPLIGPVDVEVITSQSRSPGTAKTHYAPQTPLRLIDSIAAQQGAMLVELPDTPQQAAACLYERLREADTAAQSTGCSELVVVLPPLTPPWRAIHDRLRRAAAPRS
ncbi:MAG: threonylcarbamoyl-AMP synthase [Phycisphaerales bacterium]|nr:threonylcarbamoyl-AMP synthase [Phycisphaerales bacterium]